MNPPAPKKSRFWDFALILAIAFLLSQGVMRLFFPSENQADPQHPVTVTMQDTTVRLNTPPVVVVENKSDKVVSFGSHCPNPPVAIYKVGSAASGETLTSVTAEAGPEGCVQTPDIQPGDEGNINLGAWKYELFQEVGATYVVKLPSGTGSVLSSSARFTVTEPNAFVKLFRAIVLKPLLNALVLLGAWLPWHSLAGAIVILTIIVKLLLFYPTQRALEGQKKMQLLQPKLEEVRKQYASDPQRQQAEVVKLWKEHKINPVQSCLPLLLQFPVLIGLFYVVQDGVVLEGSRHLLYPFLQDTGWSFSTTLFGLDLTVPNYYLFPPLLVAMQFIQMKLSFYVADKKKAAQIEKIEHGGVQTTEKKAQDVQQKIMLYFLPLLIGFFAIRFPAAVAIYWGVSTLFAIGQQLIVNREHLKV